MRRTFQKNMRTKFKHDKRL